MEKRIMFKIRRLSDGMYSEGGDRPTFSKNGKMWRSKQALHCHLMPGVIGKHYKDCVLEEIEVIFGVPKSIDLSTYPR